MTSKNHYYKSKDIFLKKEENKSNIGNIYTRYRPALNRSQMERKKGQKIFIDGKRPIMVIGENPVNSHLFNFDIVIPLTSAAVKGKSEVLITQNSSNRLDHNSKALVSQPLTLPKPLINQAEKINISPITARQLGDIRKVIRKVFLPNRTDKNRPFFPIYERGDVVNTPQGVGTIVSNSQLNRNQKIGYITVAILSEQSNGNHAQPLILSNGREESEIYLKSLKIQTVNKSENIQPYVMASHANLVQKAILETSSMQLINQAIKQAFHL